MAFNDVEQRYREIQRVGEGTYGTVFKALDQKTNDIVALKKIKLQVTEEGIPSTAIREICILRHLQHPKVTRLIDVFHTPQRLTLVFEFLDLDLRKYLDTECEGDIDPRILKSFMFQLLEGMHYLHQMKVLHRDLKPQNLLIQLDTTNTKNPRHVLKLADFGLARTIAMPIRGLAHEVVTLWYRAPELLMKSKLYAEAIDMWSIGCIFAEMCTKDPLFTGKSDERQLQKIFAILGTPTLEEWPEMQQLSGYDANAPPCNRVDISQLFPILDVTGLDLLEKLLQYNPSHRIDCASAMNHPYFDEIKSDR